MFKALKYLIQKHLGITAIYNSIMFSLAIQDSLWLKHKNFGLGDLGWAMDSLALHNLFRILNDVKPNNILEFGLGQSSKMVHQYAEYYSAKALTVENDQSWIDYIKESATYINFNIRQTDLETVKINGVETLSYKKNAQIDNEKFQLIIIDGPRGQRRYSRPQILDFVQRLADDFCVFIHDSERAGEQETIKLLVENLRQNNIKFLKKDYTRSTKWHTVICSSSWKFLTTIV